MSTQKAHNAGTNSAPPAPDLRTVLRSPRLWAVPTAAVALVTGVLALLYLGGVLNPQKNLHHFPIAVVNQDAGAPGPSAAETGRPPDDSTQNVGAQIVQSLKSGFDAEKIDLRERSLADAQRELGQGKLYGAIVIPANFTAALQAYGTSALSPEQAPRPTITVFTNPQAGSLSVSLVTGITSKALAQVNSKTGEQLTQQVGAAVPAGTQLTGAASQALATPVDVKTVPFKPLEEGTGNGLSVFYYALLLLMAGFTGSLVIHSLVDSRLGFIPEEFGPVYRMTRSAKISRWGTLLAKWAVVGLMAPIVSALYLVIAHALGMPEPHAFALWLYGTFAILAVGVSAISMLAAFGTLGLLINLITLIAMGLPSSGGTVPLEASPKIFGPLGAIEPMHQILLGVRALLYFDAQADAGLSRSLVMCAVGLVLGAAIGAGATIAYDRKGYQRVAEWMIEPEPEPETFVDRLEARVQHLFSRSGHHESAASAKKR